MVASLQQAGLTNEELSCRILGENSFQYSSQQATKRITRACLRRLDALGNSSLLSLLTKGTHAQAAQVNLYALMKAEGLVCSFMLDEVAPRYQRLDFTLSRIDIRAFITRFREQVCDAPAWSESTVARLASVLSGSLVQAGLLSASSSSNLLPFILDPFVEAGIRENGDAALLPAFNCVVVGS